jgi:hypothetical protein
VASRTQIVCLCEGSKGKSIDEVFINRLLKSLDPEWLRPWPGSNVVRLISCGNRKEVIERTPEELRSCLDAGGNTTLMVWADCDDNCTDPAALKTTFWNSMQTAGVTESEFEQIVFVFAKDRLENWIEYLATGNTDESREGPRVRQNRHVADAARKLADMCKSGQAVSSLPASLKWSCENWHKLRERLKKS